MPTKRASIDSWLRQSLTNDPPRSKSLIITIFGDSLLPYVSGIWLSDLITLLHPFRVNAQLARTSAFRLAEEGWLQFHRVGRKSRYSLTDSGQQRMEHASQRIYEAPPRAWDGNWTVVILNKSRSAAPDRTELRRELEWEGFALVASGVFIHPRADRATLNDVLRRLNLTQDVVVLHAHDLDGVSSRPVTRLAAECWNSDLVATHYIGFLKRFQSVPLLLEAKPDPQTAFVVQTLLIHSFRRVILHDPQLPAALLPRDWPGHAAYDLCRNIYRRTYLATRTHLAAHLDGALDSPLVPAENFLNRLGGLAAAPRKKT